MPKSSAALQFPRRREAEVVAPKAVGTFLAHPSLVVPLPPLVRKQRRLEGKIVALSPLEADEKALRKEIDQLLEHAGLKQAELVTCNGYDVTRRGQKGRSTINGVKLLEQLVAAQLDRAVAVKIILASTDTGDPSSWAEVKPSKGAKVRA
jgi:hypothetical protein